MQREEKSERSRRQVLDAALQLFSHQGFRATTVREISEAAGVSTGNVYHHFPDNIEQLGLAARDSIREFKPYFALIFVDVIEFEGTHIRKFYGGLGQRFGAFVGEEALGTIKQRLRPSVSPISALLITSRVFFNYFSIEILFNVPEPFGKDSLQAIKDLSDIVRSEEHTSEL